MKCPICDCEDVVVFSFYEYDNGNKGEFVFICCDCNARTKIETFRRENTIILKEKHYEIKNSFTKSGKSVKT